jgi:hypothetical protein
MNLDTCKIVIPGRDPGVYLPRAMDGREFDVKTRFALSPGHSS